MHLFLSIISALSLAAFIAWQFSSAIHSIQATSDNLGGVGRRLRRLIRQRQNQPNPLAAIEDPREAALALMVAVMKDRGDLTEQQISDLEQWAEHRLNYTNPQDMVALARWLVRDYVESGAVLQRVAKPMARACNGAQRADIIDLTTKAAQSGHDALTKLQAHTIKELKYKFGDLSQDVLVPND